MIRLSLLLGAVTATFIVGASRYTPAAAGEPGAEAESPSLVIDRVIPAMWKRDNLTPAPNANDAEFLRRVWLDTLGEPPRRDEVGQFLADKSEGKRAALIDRLLDDPRFGEHIADLWVPILRERGSTELGELSTSAGDVLAGWLADKVNRNVGFHRIARELITAEGPISANPAAAYYGLMGFPVRTADAAGMTIKHFAGVQAQCAQCHDHPYDDAWTQQRFVGVAAFFAPVEAQADFYTQPIDPRIETRPVPAKDALEAYLKTLKADVPPEYRGRVEDLLTYNVPQLPGDKPFKSRDPQIWRRAFADWVLNPQHPTTARYMVNRFWSFLFGIGFVNPADDFNPLNEPSHPELLDALAADFVARGYDVKRLYRAILNSRVYQLSGAYAPGKAQRWHFASAPVRQLTAEQLFGALFKLEDGDTYLRIFQRDHPGAYHRLRQLATLREMQKDKGEQPQGNFNLDRELLDKYIARIDAMRPEWRLRRALAAQYLALGQDDEMTMSETFTQSIDQALLILNGDVTRRLGGSTNGSLVYAVLHDVEGTDARVGALYLRILARTPTSEESMRAARYVQARVKAGDAEQVAFEDLFYALVSTTEFATNH
jgi:hypothetical protein